MQYFEELLSSYQKIKKRSFRVSYIVEQGPEDQKYIQAVQQFPVDQTVPPNTKAKLKWSTQGNVKGAMNANGFKTFETLDLSNFPGTKTNRLSLDGTDDAARMLAIGKAILGTEAQVDSEKNSEKELDLTQGEQPAPTEVVTPEMQAEMEYVGSLDNIFIKAKNLITQKFFRSIFDRETGKPQTDATGATKRFDWVVDDQELQDYFTSNKPQSLKRKLDNAITDSGEPLSSDQKKEIVDSVDKFFQISEKVKDGTATVDDLNWVKDHIKTGSSYSDKRSVRIKSGSTDTAVTFNWSGSVGVYKDTQLWKHALDSYDLAVEEWASIQVPQQSAENFKLDRTSLKTMAEGTGQLNAIRGFFAEDFIPMGILLQESVRLQTIDPTRSLAYKMEAAKIFTDAWNKSGDAILKAFDAHESFIGEGVAVDDIILSELSDFKELAKTFNVAITESAIKGISPEQKRKLADVLTMKVAKSLIALDSQFSLKLDADFVATTGRVESNGKKTDIAFVFKNKEEAIKGLKKIGLVDAEIDNFIMAGDKASSVFKGSDVEKFVAKAGPDSVVIPVGIKTYLKAKGAVIGTSSSAESIQALTDTQKIPTRQAKIIRSELQKKHGNATYKQHERNVQQLNILTTSLDGLKWRGTKEIPKATLEQIKAILGPRSDEYKDLKDRLDAYKKDPTLDPELRYEINKYIDDEKRNLILKRIKKGIKDGDASWLCTLDGFIRTTGSASEQNQLTVTRWMKTNQSMVMNHNSFGQELIDGLMDGSLKLDNKSDTIKFIVDCKGRKSCEADHFGSLNMSEGKFTLESTVDSIKRHHGKIISTGKVSDSIQYDLLNLLLEQRKLIDTLIVKYQ
jgi:hypothetical protein